MGGESAHALLARRGNLPDRIIKGRHKQVLQHFPVVHHARIKMDAAQFMRTGHGDFDRPTAGLAFHLDGSQFVLRLLHVVLHLLRLLH